MAEKIKILLVEDNKYQRELYVEELEEEGYEVKTAANGLEAIELFKQENPNLLIIDIQMPGINGLETIDEILTLNKTVPIIIHTAYSNYKDNFRSWTADSYVVKSSEPDKLKEEIKKVLKKRNLI